MKWFNIAFLGNEESGNININNEEKEIRLNYPCENISNSKCFPYSLSLIPGIYNISLFGAKGGSCDDAIGGKGALASAFLSISEKTNFFLFIGGKGANRIENSFVNGGYNGGGRGNQDRASGGGATDIRYNVNDMNSSLIIAAGGGGAHANSNGCDAKNGGDGGGLEGLIGDIDSSNKPCIPTQFSYIEGSGNYYKGNFGSGEGDYGGGGGGYWGGCSAWCCGSSGGSSYIARTLYHNYFISGINDGNGYAIINLIKLFQQTCNNHSNHTLLHFTFILLFIYIY